MVKYFFCQIIFAAVTIYFIFAASKRENNQ
jgi:hypothetical protein